MDYYVDPLAGDDSRSGTGAGKAWKSLGRVSRKTFKPGDRVLLARGGVWAEGLRLRGRGTPKNPIVLGAYGEGPRPRISGGETHAITATGPISAWRISGLELTSTNALNPTHKITGGTCGVYFHQGELCEGLTIEDCVIHDTSGPGIYLLARGDEKAVFSNVTIEHCEIWNASCGVQFLALPTFSTESFPGFRVAHVVVHDIGGDGIVPFCGRDGVIEHCTAYRTGTGCDPKDHSPVAIWYAWAKRCIIQFCEAYDNRTGGRGADGGGFDFDGGCTDCVMQYNYSHDNEGAGYLICSFDPKKWPCTGCITRYNVSVNDGLANDYSSILFWQAIDCHTHNNVCITRSTSPLKFLSDTHGHVIANNIFLVDSPEDIPLVKSQFAIGSNRFRNNLYCRQSGKVRFDVQGAKITDLGGFEKLTGGKGEITGDPLFAGMPAGDYRPRPGSPCRGAGLRLSEMGERDYYGTPLAKKGPVDIGCAAVTDGRPTSK